MRRAFWFSVLLTLLASARIIATYKALNHTTDEPAHLAAGIEWIENGTYTYEDQHPPLARVTGALGLHLAGARWGHGKDLYFEGFNLLGYGGRYFHNLFYSRLAMLPFFWIACAVVFAWTVRSAGPEAAVAAVLIFSATPVILGHAGLATTDMALTAFLGAAAFSGMRWIEQPGTRRALLFGLLSGLAVVSKFSTLLFLPLCLAVILAWKRPRLKPLLRSMPIVLAATTAVILLVYRFSFGPVEWLHAKLPVPEFFNGIHAVWEHNREGHPAWLLGQRSQRGFWYYYAVVTAVKTPIAIMILAAAALWYRPARLPLAIAVAILIAASFGSINIGIRHVLPIFIWFSVAGGIAAAQWFRQGQVSRVVAIALLAWLLAVGIGIHPDYFTYTNEFAGDRPDRILADSDLDWGQDMHRLADRIFQLGVSDFTFKISSPGYFAAGNRFPRIVVMPDGDHPRPGWNAISITPWRISGEPKWAETAIPRERIGRGILLYYFP